MHTRCDVLSGAAVLALFCFVSARAETPPCPRSSPEVKAALDAARTNAEQARDGYQRSELLQEVARGYAQDGDFDVALQIIRVDSKFMWQAADDLGRNMLRCGQVADVRSVASTLDGRSRSLMFEWLAEWEANHGDAAASQEALDQIKDQDIQRDTVFNIFMTKAVKGDVQAAVAEYRKPLMDSGGAQTSPEDSIAGSVAVAYAMKGDLAQAITNIDSIKSAEKIYILYTVTNILAEKSEKDGIDSFSKAALRILQPLLEDSNQAYPISLVASALGKLGQFDDAIALARNIPDEQRRAEAIVMIAVYLIADKDDQRAQQLMETLPPVPDDQPDSAAERSMGWVRIAMAEANAGEGDSALASLAKVHDPRLEGVVKWQSAYADARAGRLPDARGLAAQIPSQFPHGDRGQALRLVASVNSNEKGAPDATKWVDSLPSPEDRANGYLGIADGLLRAPTEDIPPYTQD